MPDNTPAPRMPTLFLGHGNPMNALQANAWTQAWAAIGQHLPHPRAVLCISAHWYVPQTAVTVMKTPRTIHDFGGFPRELFEVEYPAPGDPDLARRVRQLLAPLNVEEDEAWGLDHGTWSVLTHVFPQADVPVVQLSIDKTQAPAFHYELGQRLRPLRDEGMLIIGSGDVVHNLYTYDWGQDRSATFDWALRFEAKVRELLTQGKHETLVNYESLGRDAELSIPTPDHYLPLLYVLGASTEDETPSFPVEGMDGGSISMLSVQFG